MPEINLDFIAVLKVTWHDVLIGQEPALPHTHTVDRAKLRDKYHLQSGIADRYQRPWAFRAYYSNSPFLANKKYGFRPASWHMDLVYNNNRMSSRLWWRADAPHLLLQLIVPYSASSILTPTNLKLEDDVAWVLCDLYLCISHLCRTMLICRICFTMIPFVCFYHLFFLLVCILLHQIITSFQRYFDSAKFTNCLYWFFSSVTPL